MAAFWGAAALVALQLVARGRLLPGVAAGDFDAWRVGPLEPDDVERIRELAAAMPAEARAMPVPGRSPLELLDARTLVRGFLDAVADGMPRTAAAVRAAGGPAYTAAAPRRGPELRAWAHEVSAGMDSGVRVSLRLEVGGGADPAADTVEAAGENASFRAVVQVHSLADPTRVTDAGDLWGGAGAQLDQHQFDQHGLEEQDFGARARLDTVLAARAVVGRTGAPASDVPGFFGGDQLLRFD